MDYAFLGRTGMKVSKLCLGTMEFGTLTAEEEAFRIMDAALDAGINFFDTADMYGDEFGPGHRGLVEEVIGRWFAQGGGRRERTVLATKVFYQMNNPLDGPNDYDGLSAYKIKRNVENSLRRLKTDYIELYQMHDIDRRTGWEEIWEAMEVLRYQGKIVYVGSSNFAANDLCTAQQEAEKRHFMGLVSEQHHYSLLKRQAEAEVFPTAQKLGIGIMVWSPRASGRLTCNCLRPALPNSRTEKHKISEELREKLQRYSDLCKAYGYSEADVAVAWVLQNPAVTSCITGVRTMEQLEGAIAAMELKLDEEFNQKLEEIFEGPGGPAPGCYLNAPWK